MRYNGVGNFCTSTRIGARGTIRIRIAPIDIRTGNGLLTHVGDTYDGGLVCIGARERGSACLVWEDEHVGHDSSRFGGATQGCHTRRRIVGDSEFCSSYALIGVPQERPCPQHSTGECRKGDGPSDGV